VNKVVRIGKSLIGRGYPVFVIAEAGVNHNGDLGLATELIDVAISAGANAVKFQTFNADAIAATDAPKAEYQLATTTPGQSQLEMLRKLELSRDAHFTLKAYCDKRGMTFLSTPFDEPSVELLEGLSVPAYKVSSGDLTNLPLIEQVSRTGKPVIISTGMSTLEEVGTAVKTAQSVGCNELILLHCVSNYPATPNEVNLRAMRTMEQEFAVPVGFSDHTEGIAISLAAVALGAAIIEKHFTLNRNLPGPDHQASLEPMELATLVKEIRSVEDSLGDGCKKPTPAEIETAKVARRSIMAGISLKAGTVLRRDLLVLKRPGTGLPPSMVESLIGRRIRIDIPAGTMIKLEMLD